MKNSTVLMQTGTLPENDLLKKAETVFPIPNNAAPQHIHSDFIEHGSSGAFIRDINNREFLDCYTSAGTFNLGRKHPILVEALRQASRETDQGNFVAVSEEKAHLAERLSRFMPDPLSCFLFTVVRGEAMEAACKLARGVTGRPKLVTVDGGYYGDTGFALSLSDIPDKAQFGTLIPGIDAIRFNDTSSLNTIINTTCAAVILEPVQAENGCRMADTSWLKTLRKRCNETGTLLIIDETQTGFGRTGYRFTSEYSGVIPDIMIFGEAITGGMFPMTGIAFTPEVKRFFDLHPLIHLCTFGGHDVGCRTALAALDLYDRVCPWEHAGVKGNALINELKKIAADNHDIRGIHGKGLLLSIEFGDTNTAAKFCIRLKQAGVIAVQGIVAPEYVILRPPLTLSENDSVALVTALKQALSLAWGIHQ